MTRADEAVPGPAFTVFTPTHDRARTLPRVRDSLAAQTFRDFEWLVVDDGSTDGTRELVLGWAAASDFPIRYAWQENRHKKAAFNRGVGLARGRLFLTLDSDDACTPDALERFWWHWNNIPAALREGFSAVTSLCRDEAGKVVGDRFPPGPDGDGWLDSDSIEVRYRWRVRGEKWGFHRTDVLRRFPFPEDVPGLVPEGVVWSRIAREYRTRYVNEALRVYHQDATGQDRQVTRTRNPGRDAAGLLCWMRSTLELEIGWFRSAPLWFARCAANHARFALQAGRNPLREALALERPAARALAVLMLPAGGALWAAEAMRSRGPRS